MSDGGTLTIRIAEGRDWGLKIRGVRVLVADNGSGIMRKHLPRVFEPFFTTKGAEGNGIGLSIVQEIVQEHGGILRVRSSVRREASGTVFSIFLPHGIRERDPAT
jgi:signal transduction histidine kinase